MLKSFLRVRKELNILLAISVVAVVSIGVVLRDIPEIFPKGAAVGEVVYRLSLSYVASYIFYFVVIHLKAEKDRKNISAYVFTSLTSILVNATNLMRDILENSGSINTSEESVTNAGLLEALKSIGPNVIVTRLTYHIGIKDPTWVQYLSYFERRCLANISEAFEKMSLLDTELIAILGELRHSGLFRMLEIGRSPGWRNTDFERMYSDFHSYFFLCMRLRDYAIAKVLPYVEVKNPDFYRGLVPFQLNSKSSELG